MRIALAGNPNSGKTTMYNALTGKNERVGNWAGVTVDKREALIKKNISNVNEDLIAVDLPGAYSMSPFTSEESITSSYVKHENPDVIINIVDATNLSRSLFFTTQLLELGIPVVVALNKSDLNQKKQNKIDVAALSEKLGCPVIETISTSSSNEGLEKVVAAAVEIKGKSQDAPYVQGNIDLGDKKVVEEADRERFDFVNKIVKSVETRKVFTNKKNAQDKIDAVLTNKFVGIPIFVVVMWLVFFISQSTLGAWIAEGYVFEKEDSVSYAQVELFKEDDPNTDVDDEGIVGSWVADGVSINFAEDGTVLLTEGDTVKEGTYTVDEEGALDTVTIEEQETDIVHNSNDVEIPGLVTLIGMFGEMVAGWMAGTSPILQAVVVDGIIEGVGAVLGFLPLVMVMYFLLALLEDCGYMARVSVVLDPIFKRVGLSGKSIIPMIIGTGCAIPGIMACRTIRDEREKRATAILTPFIPCGAKIPVIALFAGAFFPGQGWVSPVMYFVGILLILFWATIVKVMTGYKYRKSFFIIELPEYKAPSLLKALLSMLDRGKAYIVKAGTIILVCNALVTIMASFTWNFTFVEDPTQATTILETIAHPFSVLLIPLGFGAWQLAAAAVTGFIAKEEVVGTLAAVYALGNAIDGEFALVSGSSGDVVSTIGITSVAALAYLMFNLFTPPCFAAIGAMNAEIKDKKWVFGGIGLQFATGYIVAFLVYQIGTLVTTGAFGNAFIPGLIAVAAIAAVVTALVIKGKNSIKAEYELKPKAKA